MKTVRPQTTWLKESKTEFSRAECCLGSVCLAYVAQCWVPSTQMGLCHITDVIPGRMLRGVWDAWKVLVSRGMEDRRDKARAGGLT